MEEDKPRVLIFIVLLLVVAFLVGTTTGPASAV
jgi:hypothetical protein